MLRKIIAAAIIVLVGAAYVVPASAEPRGRSQRWRRGRHYGQHWEAPNPLGGFLGGLLGGWLAGKMQQQEPPAPPPLPFYDDPDDEDDDDVTVTIKRR